MKHYNLLKESDKKAIDSIKDHYGGPEKIEKSIREMRNYENRKEKLNEKGFGGMIEKAEKLVENFPAVEGFIEEEGISVDENLGEVTTQVSGFQGEDVTFYFMNRVAEDAKKGVEVFVPEEMISVMMLRDSYVYDGGLLAELAMTENIMGVNKFCNTNFVSTPLPKKRFKSVESVTGVNIPTIPSGEKDLFQVPIVNQGTPFGNLGGVEVSNYNYLMYIDGVLRTALETGSDFFLNPSWSTITAGCYMARDIPNLRFKISMLLATQNHIQFRMLLNIMQEFLRDDGKSAIYEINLGNAVYPETFIQCAKELEESDIEGVSLSAHIRINPDLGVEDFNWFNNAVKVINSGTDITIKYESDGKGREWDTMEAYFISPEELKENADKIGEVIYNKALRCTLDAKELMKKGARVKFAKCAGRVN